jgi:hypothetical protein
MATKQFPADLSFSSGILDPCKLSPAGMALILKDFRRDFCRVRVFRGLIFSSKTAR